MALPRLEEQTSPVRSAATRRRRQVTAPDLKEIARSVEGVANGGRAVWDAFLAYASPDRTRARTLVDALTAAGVRVCFDQDVLRPGDDWHALLPQHLRAS